jgi:hypothetical protein
MANQNDDRNAQNAATDPQAAAKQDQVKRDHDVLEESARRVEASVPSHVRDTPIQPSDAAENTAQPARNADDARRNADAARDSARRVDESIPEGQERGPR